MQKLPVILALGLMTASAVASAATVSYSTIKPTLDFGNAAYTPNGSITAAVADTPDCTGGTFTVNAAPVAGSGPGGTNPPNTTITTYIGFPAGNFLFASAGYGQYTITTTTTACGVGVPPAPIVKVVNISVRKIPTLSQWGVIILSSMLAIGAAVTLRRQHSRAA